MKGGGEFVCLTKGVLIIVIPREEKETPEKNGKIE
jgi:hypothetical protein